MYDTQAILDVMIAGPVWILIFSAISTIGNIGYFLETMRLGFRDKAFSYSVAATLLGLSHDLNFVFDYHRWFVTFDDPSLKAWWGFLVFASACEIVYFWQLVRYGRDELMPFVSRAAFALICAAGLLASAVPWIVLKQFLNDDIYMMTFGVTVFWRAPFGTALMLRRGCTRGASTLQWASFVVMTIGYWSLSSVYFGGFFAQWPWQALGVVTGLWGVFNLWLTRRLPGPEAATPVTIH